MNSCPNSGTYMQPTVSGCAVCTQRNQHQNSQLQYQGGSYGPNYQNINSQGFIQHDQYGIVLNHILASLLRIEEKLNEKK